MILWALVFGMSVTLAGSGKLDMAAQVEAVFKTEAECLAIKKQLDEGSAKAVANGEVNPEINSFGAVCMPIKMYVHNKRKTTGA